MTETTVSTPLREAELCPDDLLAGQEEAYARDIARLVARVDEFVTIPCPACGAGESAPAFEKFGCAFQVCGVCKTLYMSPRPSPAVMNDYYANSENYQYWAKHIFPASEAARLEKLHRPRLERVLELCARHDLDDGALLEVGPGFGAFAALAVESGRFKRVLAIEPTPEMAAACRERGVTVIQQPIEEVRDTDVGDVDILVSFEVIEHLFDPGAFVAQAHRLLGPGGLLVLSCPNGQGFDVAMLGAGSQAVDTEHVNLFNPKSLGHLLEKSGFRVVESFTPGRLDAELVRDAALGGALDLSGDPFLKQVLLDDWERLGWPFQQFLAANGLSSHMWLVARRA